MKIIFFKTKKFSPKMCKHIAVNFAASYTQR